MPADPGIDPVRLNQLYVEQMLTTRDVAAELGVDKGRVLRALAAAGIAARPRTQRRPRGARAAMTDDALRALYTQAGMTVARAAAHFGVDEGHLRGQVHRLGLTKRPGSFTAHLPEVTLAELAERARAVPGRLDAQADRQPARYLDGDGADGPARRPGAGARRWWVTR